MQIEKKLEELGLQLPPPPPRGGLYKSCKPFGANLAYVSGCGCVIDAPVEGKLGVDFTLEEGQRYARDAMLNVLSVLKAEIGDLDRVKSCVKILVFVASANDFYSQPAVANGASLPFQQPGPVPPPAQPYRRHVPPNAPPYLSPIPNADYRNEG